MEEPADTAGENQVTQWTVQWVSQVTSIWRLKSPGISSTGDLRSDTSRRLFQGMKHSIWVVNKSKQLRRCWKCRGEEGKAAANGKVDEGWPGSNNKLKHECVSLPGHSLKSINEDCWAPTFTLVQAHPSLVQAESRSVKPHKAPQSKAVLIISCGELPTVGLF